MEILKTIRDNDLGLEVKDQERTEGERHAARAVVFDQEGKVALLHATKKRFHKLPGGGLEEGESVETALRREVLEEIGCKIANIRELGIVEEFRQKYGLHQMSHCFIADLDGEKGVPNLMEDEIADGFETEWMDLASAISTLESEAPVEDYEGKFIQFRDLLLLKTAQKVLHS